MNEHDCTTLREGFPRPFPSTPSNVLDQLSLQGRVVVVTGAADGIGYAVAEAMAEAKANVSLWYNSYGCSVCSTEYKLMHACMVGMILPLRRRRRWLERME